MAALASDDICLFEDFRLDRGSGVLFQRDQQGVFIPVAIGRRASDLLGVLVDHPGDLVSRDEIIKGVWSGTVVEDSNLSVQISTLRRVLDHRRLEDSLIQTVPGRGYRFVGQVMRHDPNQPLSVAPFCEDRAEAAADLSEKSSLMVLAPAAIKSGRPMGALNRWHLGLAIGVLGLAFFLTGMTAHVFWTPVYSWYDKVGTTAPRLSIVVLPFKDLSETRDQEYLADAIAEDLTTDLSRITGSFVISRNTAFTYKDKAVNAKQVGRELGVRYVLEGSVRRSGYQIRVNAQLIDAETNAHLWAEWFDHSTSDLFALQNEITSRIAIALNFALVRAEAARPTANPDALDYVFQAREIASKAPTRESAAKVINLYERALTLDPASSETKTRLAFALAGRVLLGMSNTAAADLGRSEGLLGQVSPDTARAHWAKGQLLRAQRRYVDAIPEYEAAVALDRNLPGAYANLGQSKLLTGSLDEVIPLMEQAIRLSPRDPDLGYWYDMIGLTHLLQSRTDEAVVWLEKARSASPGRPIPRASLAAAYGLKGESEHAADELAEARRLSANPDRYSSITRMRASRTFMPPMVRVLYEATYDEGLRKAGMPEE